MNEVLAPERNHVHTVQLVTASYPDLQNSMWSTFSRSINTYESAVTTFLQGPDEESRNFSRSLLARDFEDGPFWYQPLGQAAITSRDATIEDYQYDERQSAGDIQRAGEPDRQSTLLEDWLRALRGAFQERGSTMWISQVYGPLEAPSPQISALFVVLNRQATDKTLFALSKISRDLMVRIAFNQYDRKIRETHEINEKKLLDAINNLSGDIFVPPKVITALKGLRRAIGSRVPMLISGEIGTGKVHLARTIHDKRQAIVGGVGSCVVINCDELSDSADAVKDALRRKIFGGDIAADQVARESKVGTVVFDDVHLASLTAQKVIRDLLDVTYDIRVPDASQFPLRRPVFTAVPSLVEDASQGRFLEELWHRISIFEIELPALRHRRAELGTIVARVLESIRQTYELAELRPLSKELSNDLQVRDWPGNYRELFNVLLKHQLSSNEAAR